MKMKIEMIGKKDDKKIDKWEVDSAVSTLLEAEKIKQNPKLMELVAKQLKEKKMQVESLEDLLNKRQKIDDGEFEDDEEDEEE